MVRRGYASPEGTRQYQQYMEDLYDLGAGHWRSTQAEAGRLGRWGRGQAMEPPSPVLAASVGPLSPPPLTGPSGLMLGSIGTGTYMSRLRQRLPPPPPRSQAPLASCWALWVPAPTRVILTLGPTSP